VNAHLPCAVRGRDHRGEKALFGEQAAAEYPDRVQYMLRSGPPEDDERAELAGRFFRELLSANGVPSDSAVVYAIPTMENDAGLENLTDVIESSDIGAHTMRAYPESLCGAIPAMGDAAGVDDDAVERFRAEAGIGNEKASGTLARLLGR
jgi:hypothetical protein